MAVNNTACLDDSDDANGVLCIIVRPERDGRFIVVTCAGKPMVTSAKPIRDSAVIFLRNGALPSTELEVHFQPQGEITRTTLLLAAQDAIDVGTADAKISKQPSEPARKPRKPPYRPRPENGFIYNMLDGGSFGYARRWVTLLIPHGGMAVILAEFPATAWYAAECFCWRLARHHQLVMAFIREDEKLAALNPACHDEAVDDDTVDNGSGA